MPHLNSVDIVLIITAFFTGICSVIAAAKAGSSERVGKDNSQKLIEIQESSYASDNKLNRIHEQSNGNLQDVKDNLSLMQDRIGYLNKIINLLAESLPPEVIAAAKAKAGPSTGYINRISDVKKIEKTEKK